MESRKEAGKNGQKPEPPSLPTGERLLGEDDLIMYGYHEKPIAWLLRPSLSNPRSINDIVWAFLHTNPTLLRVVTNHVLINTFFYYKRKCSKKIEKKKEKESHQSKFNTFFFSIIFAMLVLLSLKSSEYILFKKKKKVITVYPLILHLQLVKKVCVHIQIN